MLAQTQKINMNKQMKEASQSGLMSGVNLGPINKQRVQEENVADTSKIRIVKPTHAN